MYLEFVFSIKQGELRFVKSNKLIFQAKMELAKSFLASFVNGKGCDHLFVLLFLPFVCCLKLKYHLGSITFGRQVSPNVHPLSISVCLMAETIGKLKFLVFSCSIFMKGIPCSCHTITMIMFLSVLYYQDQQFNQAMCGNLTSILQRFTLKIMIKDLKSCLTSQASCHLSLFLSFN